MEKVGLMIDLEQCYLAASPDGRLQSGALLEVKCPYNGRNKKIEISQDFPFLTLEKGLVSLSRKHNYYYQIQGQLAVAKSTECFFVIYTSVDLFVEKIRFDPEFYLNDMLPKLKSFYINFYRPFLASDCKNNELPCHVCKMKYNLIHS